MARGSTRGRRKQGKLPPFVPLTWELLNSRAYKELPFSAAKALPYFIGKVKVPYGYPETYTTEFSFSYTEARKYGFANATYHRVICKLMEMGLIDPIDKGGLRGAGRSLSVFRLSKRWREYGTPDFKETEDWKQFLPNL